MRSAGTLNKIESLEDLESSIEAVGMYVCICTPYHKQLLLPLRNIFVFCDLCSPALVPLLHLKLSAVCDTHASIHVEEKDIWKLNCVAALHQVGQQAVRLGHEVAELAMLSYRPTLQNCHAVRLRDVCEPKKESRGVVQGYRGRGLGRAEENQTLAGKDARLRETHSNDQFVRAKQQLGCKASGRQAGRAKGGFGEMYLRLRD